MSNNNGFKKIINDVVLIVIQVKKFEEERKRDTEGYAQVRFLLRSSVHP